MPDPRLVVPDHGIYACRAEVDGEAHVAAVNVGVRPTFNTGRGLLVEAFLLDFDGDIYGRELRLDFLERLRGERRFDSVDALVEQMGRDVDETRRIAARRTYEVYAGSGVCDRANNACCRGPRAGEGTAALPRGAGRGGP